MKNLSISSQRRKDTRQFERRPYLMSVDYSLNIPDPDINKSLRGDIFDISDKGVGIETDYPLSPGHIVWFNGEMGNRRGTVKWSTRFNDRYRVGVMLIEEQLISEEDEAYSSNLEMATQRFIDELKGIEQRCSNHGENPGELMSAIVGAFENMMLVCEEYEQGVKDRKIIRDARVKFHEKTNPVLSASYCINRVRTWPQGQQGDYKTLELIYKDTPLSEGFGYYLDLYALSLPLGAAVRNRIKVLENMLRDEIKGRIKPNVLNIACGSCRELMGIVPEISASGAKVVCIDNDDDALAFAESRLSYAKILSHLEFRKYNAIRMFDDELNMMEFGKQDVIYSVGLFDYLPDDFLVRLLRALYNLLNPGGRLIAAFKDADRYKSQVYHWIFDWDGFLQRNVDDFNMLFQKAGIPASVVKTEREDSGIIVFYTATK